MAHYILERFPGKAQSIDRLIEDDPDFLGLCEDYDLCVDALIHWTKSKAPEAEIRVQEYSALAKELEEDVSQALAKLKPQS